MSEVDYQKNARDLAALEKRIDALEEKQRRRAASEATTLPAEKSEGSADPQVIRQGG